MRDEHYVYAGRSFLLLTIPHPKLGYHLHGTALATDWAEALRNRHREILTVLRRERNDADWTALVTQTILQTNRIRFPPLADEQLDHEIQLVSDSEIMRYLASVRARTRDEVEVLHRNRLNSAELVPGLGFSLMGT